MTERKRFAYWVIVAGAQPTSFRARQAEDLLPTLRQLQRTQPTAELKWFERGRFWHSKEAAAAAARDRRKPAGRGPDWRPGGSHADPRARYTLTRDQKRARFKRNLTRRRDGSGADQAGEPGERPQGSRPKTEGRPRPKTSGRSGPGASGPGRPKASGQWRPKASGQKRTKPDPSRSGSADRPRSKSGDRSRSTARPPRPTGKRSPVSRKGPGKGPGRGRK